MDKILHDPKDPKLWELWYIPYYGSCRILSINRIVAVLISALCFFIFTIAEIALLLPSLLLV